MNTSSATMLKRVSATLRTSRRFGCFHTRSRQHRRAFSSSGASVSGASSSSSSSSSVPPSSGAPGSISSSILLGIGVAASVYGGFLAYEFWNVPEPVETALIAAQAHPEIFRVLGAETKRSIVWDGVVGQNMATISFSLLSSGSFSQSARIASKLARTADGSWQPFVLIATFSNGETVDLLSKKKP